MEVYIVFEFEAHVDSIVRGVFSSSSGAQSYVDELNEQHGRKNEKWFDYVTVPLDARL